MAIVEVPGTTAKTLSGGLLKPALRGQGYHMTDDVACGHLVLERATVLNRSVGHVTNRRRV